MIESRVTGGVVMEPDTMRARSEALEALDGLQLSAERWGLLVKLAHLFPPAGEDTAEREAEREAERQRVEDQKARARAEREARADNFKAFKERIKAHAVDLPERYEPFVNEFFPAIEYVDGAGTNRDEAWEVLPVVFDWGVSVGYRYHENKTKRRK